MATMYKMNGSGVTMRKDTQVDTLENLVNWLTSHNYKHVDTIESDNGKRIFYRYRKESCGTTYTIMLDK